MNKAEEGMNKKESNIAKIKGVCMHLRRTSQQITAISIWLAIEVPFGGTAGSSASLSVSLVLSGKGSFQLGGGGGSVVAVHLRRTACCYQIFTDGSGEVGKSSSQNAPSVQRHLSRPKKSAHVDVVLQKLKKKHSGWSLSWQDTENFYRRKWWKSLRTDASRQTNDSGHNYW